MSSATKISLALALVLASSSMALANKYSHKTAKRYASPYESSTSGPRMIEVRRGLWISNYECVTDEGYGRYRSCSSN